MYRLISIVMIIILTTYLVNTDYSLTYRIIYPNNYEETTIIDLNNTNLIEFKQYRIPVFYENAVVSYREYIVRKSIQTIAVDQSIDNKVELVKYRVYYIEIIHNNTIYELYYDTNTSILVYSIIYDKVNELDYEIILKTNLINLFNQSSFTKNTGFESESTSILNNVERNYSNSLYIVLILLILVLSITTVFVVKRFIR